MVGRDRGHFLKREKSDYAGRHCLSDVRAILEISAPSEPKWRKRDAGGYPGEELSVGRRMSTWGAGSAHLGERWYWGEK